MEDGAYDAARQARANFVDVQGRNAIVDGTRGDVHLGDHHHYTTPAPTSRAWSPAPSPATNSAASGSSSKSPPAIRSCAASWSGSA
ncbi:hypothetical protein DMB38_15020 [Streptomyces sp. WAC 06738]|nr:hypothetical protein DMB38_15020 [Streptomyces sp. WAC 06738]